MVALAAVLLLPITAWVIGLGTQLTDGTHVYTGFTLFLCGLVGLVVTTLILTVLDSLLTILNASQALKQILYGAIILALAWLYARTSSGD